MIAVRVLCMVETEKLVLIALTAQGVGWWTRAHYHAFDTSPKEHGNGPRGQQNGFGYCWDVWAGGAGHGQYRRALQVGSVRLGRPFAPARDGRAGVPLDGIAA